MSSPASIRIRRRGIAAIAAGLAALAAATAGTAGAAQAIDSSSDRPTIRSPGFLFEKGRYRAIQVPGARTHTYAHGINNRGQIAGGFDNPGTDGPNGIIHGTIRKRNGRFVRFDVPGAMGTVANKMNDHGLVVGGYNETSPSVGAATGGESFLRRRGGKLKTIRVPGSVGSQALGVNNHRVVVGEYLDADGVFHGFRWKDGRLTTIDGPGSLGGIVADINDRGQMVGAYITAGGTARGFLLSRGAYTTFDVPYGSLDLPLDINNRGQIVGSTLSDPTGTESHGFLLRKGVDGPFTKIDFPRTSQTLARGIDDHGRIVGLYGNPDTVPTAARATRSLTGRLLGLPLAGEER
jgi:probable HAF family extracellular repeat protein